MNIQGISYSFYPSQGKARENQVNSLPTVFINSYTVVRKVVVPFVVSKYELYHFT